ncbi:MAG TPA: GNAT family N-acetyltransferase [Ilumatobacter sp.]|jgi:GNAT superfamily N-acetyltransferase|nr:GNAT family N-acetyltransferase [Ilumatobacter sp.]
MTTQQLEHVTNPTIRTASLADADRCGQIFYNAFAAIANLHNFPVEPGSPEFANYKTGELLEAHGIHGVVAEHDGTIVGSAFADERSAITGIGPVAVDPTSQNAGVGTALMRSLLQRQHDRNASGVRLVQTAYHSRSLALYARLGFIVREPLSVLQGTLPSKEIGHLIVRPARLEDGEECAALCVAIHGHDRKAERQQAIEAGTATVVERGASIVGYATGFGYGWHAVAENNEALIAMLSSAPSFMGLGILVPSRNGELLRWCLQSGMRLIQQSTLMTIGLYNEPAGAWLPSIVY